MSYDPTQQVPPPQYPPVQPGYGPPPAYPPPAPPPPAPATYTQYAPQSAAPAGAGFDFNRFWRSLGLTGQVAGIAGIAILIFAIFPWISAPTDSFNGFSTASGSFDSSSSINFFPYLWLVLLGAVGLIAIAWLISRRRLSSQTGAVAVIATSAVALALEICFLIEANSLFKDTTGGTGAGFWLAAIATAAALIGGIYGLSQQRKTQHPYQPPAYPDPYQQAPQYPPYPGQ